MEQEKELKGQVLSSENVARILSKEWFVKEKLNAMAFTLDLGETYLSVNRTAVSELLRMATVEECQMATGGE